MFGKDLPDSTTISVAIKIAVGRGHPLMAWTGAPKTPEQDIIEDISRNTSVTRYLYKAIDRGRINPDELGCCQVPAYLCVLEDNQQIDETPIQLTLNLSPPKEDLGNPAVLLEKMFSMYAQAIDKITVSSTSAIEKVASSHSTTMSEAHKVLGVSSAESAKLLAASAQESSRILAAAVEPLKAQMALIDKSHAHETTRADKATDAVVRMLNSETKGKSDIVDDFIKLLGAAPALLALVEKAKKGVS